MDILYYVIIFFIVIIIIYLALIAAYSDDTDQIDSGQKGDSEPVVSNKIINMLPVRSNMPLCQYSIKASYNTAYDGSKISTDMITTVISKGCRFLDLEIFYIGDIPCVGYSLDPTFTNLNSKNSIPLIDAFNAILSNAFSSMTCGNPTDPLFIQLRIKSKKSESDKNKIYKSVASIINMAFSSSGKLFMDSENVAIKVDKNTILSDLTGKIVFIIDNSIINNYDSYTSCYDDRNCVNLTNFINMESGGNTLYVINYSSILNKQTLPPVIYDDYTHTNASELYLAVPDQILNVKNPKVSSFMLDYGYQTVAYQFWKNDENLIKYESIFNQFKSAIVPFAYTLYFLKQQKQY